MFGSEHHTLFTHLNLFSTSCINPPQLPSQFMENWCYDRKTLFGFARHYQTGEALPEELYQRLLAARTYR